MAITVTLYGPILGPVVTTTAGTLRYDGFRNCLWTYLDSTTGAFRRYTLEPPYVEVAQHSYTRAAWDCQYPEYIICNRRNGDFYAASSQLSDDLVRFSPLAPNSALNQIEGANSNTAWGGDVSRDSSGAEYILTHGGLAGYDLFSISASTGDIALISSVGSEVQNYNGGWIILGIPPNPTTGNARWLGLPKNTGGDSHQVFTIENVAGVITQTVRLTLDDDAASTTDLFGAAMGFVSNELSAVWDSVNNRVILMAPQAASPYTIRLVALSATDFTTVAWRQSLTPATATLQLTQVFSAHENNLYLPVAWSNIATHLTMQAALVRLLDGVIVDSGTYDPVGTGTAIASGILTCVWDEHSERLFVQAGGTAVLADGTTARLMVVEFDLVLYPSTPTYPVDTNPPPGQLGVSQKLVAGPVVQVINQNTAVIQTLLSELVDATSLSSQNPTINLDLNGYSLTSLASSAADNAPARQT